MSFCLRLVFLSLPSEAQAAWKGAARWDLVSTWLLGEGGFEIFQILLYTRIYTDRCSKRRLPGLVSSLYSCQLTHPHYITIRLPLKVILPEHNHTQSKPQTSYITETVNSPRVYFLLLQKTFCSIRKMTVEWLWCRSTSFFWFKIK